MMERMLYQKEIPVMNHYDVIVCGSGPAGICAAVAAARSGVKTALIERYGVLGGNLTTGCVGPVMGSVSKGTMRDELTELLSVGYNDIQGRKGRVHDMNYAKSAITKFVHEAGAEVYLQTAVCDVIKDDCAIKGVILSGKQGLFALSGEVVIDATGDGDVGFLCGERYGFGRDEDGLLQPVTLMYVIDGVDESRAITCIGEEDNVKLGEERFLDVTARFCKQGVLPENTSSVRLYKTVNPGERLVNTTQVNYVNPLNHQDVMRAELELRNQIDQINAFLKKYVPGYEQCRVKMTADTLGIRESRRIMGEYILHEDDLRSGKRFEDVVVHKANFVVDIHNPTGGGQAYGLAEVVQPYDIPYRCLIPEKTDYLILTGRCISGTHQAHASYRIMTVCMALGEAAGIAAALSVKEHVMPRKMDYHEIQKVLVEKGAVLFD